MEKEYIQIQITTKDREEADTIATILIDNRLVASVQIIPNIISLYRWEERVHKKEEFLLLIHTIKKHVESVSTLIHEYHSYRVPQYIVLPLIEGSSAYFQWITDSTL